MGENIMTDIYASKIKTSTGYKVALYEQGRLSLPIAIIDENTIKDINKEWKRKDI